MKINEAIVLYIYFFNSINKLLKKKIFENFCGLKITRIFWVYMKRTQKQQHLL